MSPKEYLDRYTNLSFTNPITGYSETVNITGYGSGWGPEPHCNRTDVGPICNAEHRALLKAVRFAHHGADTQCGAKFYFKDRPLHKIPTTEEFYGATLTQALLGKGSPDEITDTLRLAIAVGRIGSGRDAAGMPSARTTIQSYADDFITLDCNGLTGNYYGINPEYHISTYADAARKRKTVESVKVGDCAVTATSANPYEHVALIGQWDVKSPGVVDLSVVEWGEAGDESVHYYERKGVDVTRSNGGVYFLTRSGKTRYIYSSRGTEHHGWS